MMTIRTAITPRHGDEFMMMWRMSKIASVIYKPALTVPTCQKSVSRTRAIPIPADITTAVQYSAGSSARRTTPLNSIALPVISPDPALKRRAAEAPIDCLVNNAIMIAVPKREHAGAATEGFC
jgi:hypothetical protein